jgi:hypothetical protein
MRVVDAVWVLAAAAALAYLFVDHARHASLRIDGVRVYWLDDDVMISMRYARNLAHGLGLVWNPGERVEGYTNFGWTLLMAAIHLLPIPDAQTALWVQAAAFACCVGTVVLVRNLVRVFDDRTWSPCVPLALAGVVTCTDVVLWAVAGFETALTTVAHVWVVTRTLQKRAVDPGALIALALIPIVRSDGLHVWVGDALLVLLVARVGRRELGWLAITLVPFAAHLLFRHAYYGAWLPNTYYLKVYGLDDPVSRGARYVEGFVARYAWLLAFAGASAFVLWRRDRRAACLATTLVPPMLYSLSVGGDAFEPFRFFAHTMPELFVFAALGAGKVALDRVWQGIWFGSVVCTCLPWRGSVSDVAGVGSNGDPFNEIVTAAILRKNADPESSVAVITAGMVPYFSHLRSVDLLGKSDPTLAHLPYHPHALIGHGKVDPAISFARRPDYFVSSRPLSFAASLAPPPPDAPFDYVQAILSAPIVRRDYLPNPAPDPFLRSRTEVYVRGDSPELARLDAWRGVMLEP